MKRFKCPYCPNEYTDYTNMLRHKCAKATKSRISSNLETYPVMGMKSLEKSADLFENIWIRDKVLQLFNNLKNKKKENDESCFLYLNRYDPSST